MSKNTIKSSVKKTAKPAAKAPKAPRADRVEKNGIVQPREGSKTRKVWDIAAKLTEKNGNTAHRGEVIAAAIKVDIDKGTAATQYGYWRAFNGITGRIGGKKTSSANTPKGLAKSLKKPVAKAPKAPKAPAAPAAPAAPVVPPAPAAAAS